MDPALQRLIDGVTAKRPRTVLQHILKHGHITTAELNDLYGYNHPPRAARDVREQGIPLETFRTTGPDGRTIAAYRLGDPTAITARKAGGRRPFSKIFKNKLVEHYGDRCALCGWQFPARALQIDHRVPYEVAGEAAALDDLDAYMLLCGSCNRTKSWTCEGCEDWLDRKRASVCQSCMWGSPDDYTHIATEERRTLMIAWQHNDVDVYDELREIAAESGTDLPEFAREILKREVE